MPRPPHAIDELRIALQGVHSELRAARKAAGEPGLHLSVQESIQERLEETERNWVALRDSVLDLSSLIDELEKHE